MSRAINYEALIGPMKLQQDSFLATRDHFFVSYHTFIFISSCFYNNSWSYTVVSYFKRVAISIPLQKQSANEQIFFKYFAIFLTCQRENVLTYIVSRILVSK